MDYILNESLETTPEDLLPIVEKILYSDPIWAFLGLDDLRIEIAPEYKRNFVQLPGGIEAMSVVKVPSSRPEFIKIMFFGREIGQVQVKQKSRYPSLSRVVVFTNGTIDEKQDPTLLGGDHQAFCIMHRLAEELRKELNIEPTTPKIQKTAYQENLDSACVSWANRGYSQYKIYNMDEFLHEWDDMTGSYYSKNDFKRALKDAYRRGLIDKNKRRYCPKTRS